MNDNPFSLGDTYAGLRIHIQEPRFEPVITLKTGLCSFQFEREMQMWLNNIFGTRDVTPIKLGQAIVSPIYGFAVMRREDVVKLSGYMS